MGSRVWWSWGGGTAGDERMGCGFCDGFHALRMEDWMRHWSRRGVSLFLQISRRKGCGRQGRQFWEGWGSNRRLYSQAACLVHPSGRRASTSVIGPAVALKASLCSAISMGQLLESGSWQARWGARHEDRFGASSNRPQDREVITDSPSPPWNCYKRKQLPRFEVGPQALAR